MWTACDTCGMTSTARSALIGLLAGTIVAGLIITVANVAAYDETDNGTSTPAAVATQPASPAPAAQPTTFVMEGAFALTDNSAYEGIVADGAGCSGSGGYSDISAGTQVAVYSASGDVIGVGALRSGTRTSPSTCVFDVHVPNVPLGESFYQVEVAHRGMITVTAADAEYVMLSLGDEPA